MDCSLRSSLRPVITAGATAERVADLDSLTEEQRGPAISSTREMRSSRVAAIDGSQGSRGPDPGAGPVRPQTLAGASRVTARASSSGWVITARRLA